MAKQSILLSHGTVPRSISSSDQKPRFPGRTAMCAFCRITIAEACTELALMGYHGFGFVQ